MSGFPRARTAIVGAATHGVGRNPGFEASDLAAVACRDALVDAGLSLAEVDGLFWVGGGTHPGSGLLTILESANIAADYLAQQSGKSGLPKWPYTPGLDARLAA